MSTEPQKPLVLLVEDEEDDAFFFERTFEKAGLAFTMDHVFNGAAVIELLGKSAHPANLPRIIFLDLKMPVLNGFDVLTWMQKQTFPFPIPVVVLSGSEQEKDKIRAKELGAVDYLVKPISPDDLRRVVENIYNPAQARTHT